MQIEIVFIYLSVAWLWLQYGVAVACLGLAIAWLLLGYFHKRAPLAPSSDAVPTVHRSDAAPTVQLSDAVPTVHLSDLGGIIEAGFRNQYQKGSARIIFLHLFA